MVYGKCEKCNCDTSVVKNETHCVFFEYCTSCDWSSDYKMWESGDSYEILTNEQALEKGLAKYCPVSGMICQAWEIDEVGMSIVAWHNKNKRSLTK